MKYFAYCRKSSEGEERQALSIPAQIDEIKRVFDGVLDVEIAEWFEEKMSAKAPGRPVWSAMIKRIEKGDADGIVAWHPDRGSSIFLTGAFSKTSNSSRIAMSKALRACSCCKLCSGSRSTTSITCP
jgi:DNA invertase Pin-like site-specific DNA recombinase